MASGIGVFDRYPAFRLGIALALRQQGRKAVEVEDLPAWAATGGQLEAVVTLRGPDDLDALRSARRVNPGLTAVVLQECPDATVTRAALGAGAAAVCDAAAGPSEILATLDLARAGNTVVPATVSRAACEPGDCGLTTHELMWIRALARGATVVDLAHQAGYSEREMYRRLHSIYRRMGVAGRAQALVAVARSGLID